MISSDSDLIFFISLSLASVTSLSASVEEISCSHPPIRQSVLKAAVDVWRLATGGVGGRGIQGLRGGAECQPVCELIALKDEGPKKMR